MSSLAINSGIDFRKSACIELNNASIEVLGKAALVELKNGRVLFKQKPLSFEKHSETLQGPWPTRFYS